LVQYFRNQLSHSYIDNFIRKIDEKHGTTAQSMDKTYQKQFSKTIIKTEAIILVLVNMKVCVSVLEYLHYKNTNLAVNIEILPKISDN